MVLQAAFGSAESLVAPLKSTCINARLETRKDNKLPDLDNGKDSNNILATESPCVHPMSLGKVSESLRNHIVMLPNGEIFSCYQMQ
jgi:hypothetical protein